MPAAQVFEKMLFDRVSFPDERPAGAASVSSRFGIRDPPKNTGCERKR
jgi:hypothetical protein